MQQLRTWLTSTIIQGFLPLTGCFGFLSEKVLYTLGIKKKFVGQWAIVKGVTKESGTAE